MIKRRSKSNTGSALVELTLLAPWILFLFVGVVDLGFYSYALISVENAARVAAEYTSQSSSVAADATTACTMVRAELANLPNLSGLSSCSATPLTVTATSATGPDGAAATSVSVTYQGVSLIPIPGMLMGRLNVTRNVQMMVQP
jgi:Flp pilus assembly protein TadG